MALQFTEKDVVGDRVKGFTKVQIDGLTSFVPSDTEKVNASIYFSMSLVWTYWMLREAKSAWLNELILVPRKSKIGENVQ